MMVAAIVVGMLVGASLIIFRLQAMQTLSTAGVLVVLFMLLYGWGVLH